MKAEQSGKHSHLFTLRLWAEQLEEGQSEWRGRVHCAGTDEVRYFQGWPSLIPLLLAMLREIERKENTLDLLQSPSTDNTPDSADS